MWTTAMKISIFEVWILTFSRTHCDTNIGQIFQRILQKKFGIRRREYLFFTEIKNTLKLRSIYFIQILYVLIILIT